MGGELKPGGDTELLKLRLRGKGSGYKEGPEQQESAECLHLCVSAKDEAVYSQACQRVEKLLASIYQDYADFTRRQGRTRELCIKKVVLGSNVFTEETNGYSYGYPSSGQLEYEGSETAEELYRITPEKIGELL